jgi:CheY-like chemotaxis protein
MTRPGPSTRPRVLVVEDNPDTHDLLRAALARADCGADFEFADGGPVACEIYFRALGSGRPFGALILDCALPHLDGFGVARIVRACEENCGIAGRARLAFYTAYDQTVERSSLLGEVGADAYWRKHEAAERLPDLICSWLEEVDLL